MIGDWEQTQAASFCPVSILALDPSCVHLVLIVPIGPSCANCIFVLFSSPTYIVQYPSLSVVSLSMVFSYSSSSTVA